MEQERGGYGASQEFVKDLIGLPKDIEYVNVQKHGFKTLDGRYKEECLSTPGGDMGEFLLGLQVLTDMLGANVKLGKEVVRDIL